MERNVTSCPMLVVGGGNMGRAILFGAVRAGVIDGRRVVVVDPDPGVPEVFAALGVACASGLPEGIERFFAMEVSHGLGRVLLAVKPQMLGAVAPGLAEAMAASPRLVLSILAGTPTARLHKEVGGRIVRLMPNTPARIGRGITAMCAGPGATDDDLAAARRLFGAVGRVIDLPEDLLDAFTAVAGSGPAYVFSLAEGMAAGAEAVGFSRAQALEIVRATVAGAAGLLDAEPETEPATLRGMVTSKGGTTAAAMGVLDSRGVGDALRDAIVAARDRGRELGG